MVKIQIGKKKKKAKKKGVVPTKAKAEKNPAVKAAEEAVANFDEGHQTLLQMQADFKEQHPEAVAFLDVIKQQQDEVEGLIEVAKLKVRTAKLTVGEFVCQRKWSQAGYDGKKMMTIITDLENIGEVVEDLIKEGVVEAIGLSKSALSFIAGRPEYSELFQPAFEDKKEKTPAVTTPKI